MITNIITKLESLNAKIHNQNTFTTGDETIVQINFTIPEPLTAETLTKEFNNPDLTFITLIDGQDGNGGDLILCNIIQY